MKILLLSTADQGGGAERVARDLQRAYQAAGHDARMLVGAKYSDDPTVQQADLYAGTSPWAPGLRTLDQALAGMGRVRGRARLQTWLRRSAWPQRWLDSWSGVEDFNYPYAHGLLGGDWRPDVVHAHNLHGDYFDLRALCELSHHLPLIWTLHDAWALTGHCAHFIECPRWLEGCGACPDLRRAPAMRADRTADNWQRKRAIYAASRLAIATPSRWLMQQVERSMLRPQHARVIPNGVDRARYHPADKQAARAALGLPERAFICMFIAQNIGHGDAYKDPATVERAVQLAAQHASGRQVAFVRVGSGGGVRQTGHTTHILETGYIAQPERIAQFYQAADVLLHAARIENFPCVLLEAMACGTPVIATAVGGIAEQIEEGQAGFLVGRGDSAAMAARIGTLLADPGLAARMGAAATLRVQQHYDLARQSAAYLEWFEELGAIQEHERDTRPV
jgi:glycosyltransferase involved in cell wall biosynthesis